MSSTDTVAILNRVLAIVLRSFPQYLRWARPYVPPRHKHAVETLEKIVTEQDALAERITDAIVDLGGLPDAGEFPMEFTDTHDLGIDYLIREAIGYGGQDMVDLEAIAATPDLSPPADSLVAEALTTAKRHLAALEELADKDGSSASVRNSPPASGNE
jgi:hypothetical protein